MSSRLQGLRAKLEAALEQTSAVAEDDLTLLDLILPGRAEELEEGLKPPFSFPAGKMRMAKEMVALMPAHKTYVEPFAGSAAVFFAKEKAPVEVLNDLNDEVAQALSDLKALSDADIERLIGCSWKGDKARYEKLFGRKSRTPVGRLHRFLYLAKFSVGSTRKKSAFCKLDAGRDARDYIKKRIKPAVDRLKNVTVLSLDYEDVIKRYDAKDTLFFIDPPYKFTKALSTVSKDAKKTSEHDFDEDRFLSAIANIKGKVLINYGSGGKVPEGLKDYKTTVVQRRRSFGIDKKKDTVPHLIGVNYDADLSGVGNRGGK